MNNNNNQTVSVRTGGMQDQSQADQALASKLGDVKVKTEDFGIAAVIVDNIENPKIDDKTSDEEKKRMADEKAIWEGNDVAARQALLDGKIAKAKEVAAILKAAEAERKIPDTYGLREIKSKQDEKKVVLSRTAAIAWGCGIGLGAALVAALVTYFVMKAKKEAAQTGSDTIEV